MESSERPDKAALMCGKAQWANAGLVGLKNDGVSGLRCGAVAHGAWQQKPPLRGAWNGGLVERVSAPLVASDVPGNRGGIPATFPTSHSLNIAVQMSAG